MANDIQTKWHKVNVKRQIDRLAAIGYYNIHHCDLDFVLTEKEYKVLERIKHEKDCGALYISYSLIEATTRLDRKTFSKVKADLIKIGFLKDKKTTNLGTSYKIEYTKIAEILEKIIACDNRIERLRLADKFRISKGLKALNTSVIKKFTDSSFDVVFKNNSDRYKDIPDEPNTDNTESHAKNTPKEKEPINTEATQNKPNIAHAKGKEPNTAHIEVIPNIPKGKQMPKQLFQYICGLNQNEDNKRKGNDMYYYQKKEAFQNDFNRYALNEYNLNFDGQNWKAVEAIKKKLTTH
ncbi:hypothetical protein EZS27_022649 [termite gut metagenome]|uniref:Uncharacterized protein n=1 Tax=termite gut metagenome TaxID=433724 RepID=A0A5J4R406_9ZZZZ